MSGEETREIKVGCEVSAVGSWVHPLCLPTDDSISLLVVSSTLYFNCYERAGILLILIDNTQPTVPAWHKC